MWKLSVIKYECKKINNWKLRYLEMGLWLIWNNKSLRF